LQPLGWPHWSLTASRGGVCTAAGVLLEISGLANTASMGDHLTISTRTGLDIPVAIVGYRDGRAQVSAFSRADGVGPDSIAWINVYESKKFLKCYSIMINNNWVGRVMDPLCRPIDGKGILPFGTKGCGLYRSPPSPTVRGRLGRRIDFGVKVLDLFTTSCHGQRLGLFAGAGVGKSTLLSMIAKNASCDIAVVALIGERGREVREFIEDDLGAVGLARSVVVVATSDQPALMRREAAYTAMTVAEHFRDQGKNVLLLIDSLTRFCISLREIGLSAGEPPTTRGYPPSVFSELPRLLERAGPGVEKSGRVGQITGLFTVLVEGDDLNEPIADAVRGILDGHVVLDRRIAERGRFPAVDVLRSLSRTAENCLEQLDLELIKYIRKMFVAYSEISELHASGLYKKGSNEFFDKSLNIIPSVEEFLNQSKFENISYDSSIGKLRIILS